MQPIVDTKNRFHLLRLTIWHFLFPLVIGYTITFFAYPKGFGSISIMVFVTFYSLSIGILSMKVYEFLEWKIEKYMSWLERPILRFFISITVEIVAGFIPLLIVNYLFFMIIYGQTVDEFMRTTYNAIKYLIASTVISILIINLISFFKNWRQSALNEEMLKREILSAQYESFKNQVNPHFLFNNLTALTSLVRTDPEKAVQFIQEMANTFRYVLENKDNEVIELAKECSLIESLAKIYQIRNSESLEINLGIKESKNKYIMPMALQMLVENAVKHNIVSTSKPLIIDIFEENDYIVVRNNNQPKTSKVLSNGIGLKNIQMRYRYHSSKEIVVENSEKFFTVKLPILKIQP